MTRAEAMRRHPAGSAIGELDEVAEHRMDLEAVALANSGRKSPRLPDWVGGLLLGLWIYALVVGIAGFAALVAGWPL